MGQSTVRFVPMPSPARGKHRLSAFQIQILVFPESTPTVPVGLADLLRKAGQLAASSGMERKLEISLVAASESKRVATAAGLELGCRYTLRHAPKADLIVVSPCDPPVLDRLSRAPATLAFLRRAYARGADLASVCTGAFCLAETGLLDGRRAATHWAFQATFMGRFPRVRLCPQEILVDTGRIISTGGATSFLNFALYLIERLFGAETARDSSRMFLIDERKAPQGAYAIFSGQKAHGDDAVLEAQAFIEDGGAGLSVESVAARVAMTRRTFIRRFKAATGSTPRDYLQRARVEAAKRRLETTNDRVAEVAGRAGYQDIAAFRRLFQRHTGLTPSEYRDRYAKPRRAG